MEEGLLFATALGFSWELSSLSFSFFAEVIFFLPHIEKHREWRQKVTTKQLLIVLVSIGRATFEL